MSRVRAPYWPAIFFFLQIIIILFVFHYFYRYSIVFANQRFQRFVTLFCDFKLIVHQNYARRFWTFAFLFAARRQTAKKGLRKGAFKVPYMFKLSRGVNFRGLPKRP